ncbi:MAG: thioredoxin family protein [Gemmatimonadota bacterium]
MDEARFQKGLSFPAYLDTVVKNRAFWLGLEPRAKLQPAVTARLGLWSTPWHLVALAEDWCGDAVNVLPWVARLAEGASNVSFRVFSRDGNPDLMDAHLTGGVSRSIPVIIAYDEHFREHGWWGPRPRELQSWVKGEGQTLTPADRYVQVRRWYARDKGRSTLGELLSIMGWSPAEVEELFPSTLTYSV